MEMLRVDAWDEKKCVHASTLETGLMHGAENSGRRLQREGFCPLDPEVEPAGCQGSRAAIYSS